MALSGESVYNLIPKEEQPQEKHELYVTLAIYTAASPGLSCRHLVVASKAA